MASDSELDRNAIFEKFASIKRMHDEVGKKQTEDYQKRLQKLKEEESNYMSKLLSQQISTRSQQDESNRVQNSARRDLFLTSKNSINPSDPPLSQQHYSSYKLTNRSSSHHQDSYDNGDYEWNIDDDFQPLNITDNEILDERITNRITNDDEPEDSYITAYNQLLQTHHHQHQQQQQIITQQEQENMLSTIFEASCEDATPMTSLIDVHQQRIQISPSIPIYEDNHSYEEEEKINHPKAPSFSSIDEIPVSTIFTKNEKYFDICLRLLLNMTSTLESISLINKSTICNTTDIKVQNSSFINDSSSSSKLAYSYSTIEENLECPLCLTRFHDPRALPCQHIYCCSCLNMIISSNKSYIKIICPLCRQKFSYKNLNDIPKSYIHNQLLDLIPINYNIKGNCIKCKINTLLNLCLCCDYYLCQICIDNDRKNLLINLKKIFNICYNNCDHLEKITSIKINDLLYKTNFILTNSQKIDFNDILSTFKNLNFIYQHMNKLPITRNKQTYENSLDIKNIRIESTICLNEQQELIIEDDVDDDDDDIIYIKTIQSTSTSILLCAIFKDETFINQNQGTKEKRPFLRKRQGLAHYQAPPKRRQTCPKIIDTTNNTKTEPIKRPTSASSNSRSATINQRTRSNSSSASMVSNRQTSRSSLKNKPIKQINNINSTKQITSISTQSNLLGKVDLDDEDDLLTKYQTKQNPIELNDNDNNDDDEFTSAMNKFNSNIQTMIDSKWNAYKTSFHHNEQEQIDDDDDDLYSTNRQRTSSRSSAIQSKISLVQPKKDLDEFEKLEQYAEEHPSMISTASYVDKVVFNNDQPSKTVDIVVNRLIHYHKEENDSKHEEINNLSTNTNRIRQRKIIPFKNKIDTRIEQIPTTVTVTSDHDDDDDDDDDDEDHKWDDIEVAKVIPVVNDDYNSDSGISSFKTDFSKQTHYQQKKDSARSSDFGDDHSWADRVNAPPLNSLMLNTFPGLRHTVPTSAPVVPPPPPPPPPPPSSVSEHNQDYSRLVREKAKELEKQIELFEKENTKLQSLCNERNLAIKKLKQDRDEFEKTKQKEIEEFNQMKEDEIKKLKHEKRLFEQHRQQLRDHPDKREREEIEILKKQVLTLQEDLKQREMRWSTTVNRLKERIETLEYENAELKQEKDIIERKRLDLMHQLQTTSKQQLHEDTSSLSTTTTTRKSLIELQQTKQRPKSTGPTTSKTQSLPKTMVVRNSEPSIKSKVTTNGRRTPTTVVGVNGIKNNVDTSRKLSTLPTTKRPTSMNELTETMESVPIPTIIEPPIVISERADSGNGGSDDDSHRYDRKTDEHLSPSLSSIINSDYPKTFIDNDESNHPTTLDYKSLLTMATRTSSSATTLLQRHQETLSLLDQSTTKRQLLSTINHDSIIPRSHINIPSSTTKNITFKENISIPTNNSIIEEIHHNDGRIERIKSDLSKQILFPNGSKQEISSDGKQIRVQFYNGDYKEKLSDGRCIYKYASTNTTETEYPDGTHIYEFPNGQIEKHLPDGRQEHILPDKTKNIYLTDGTIISIKTNGEKFIQHPNQTKEVHTDTYKRKLFPNGSILTVFNTGEQEVRYANGKIKIKDAQGNIIVEKKNSNK
ncbi:unnamed protein product [Rotaria sp. Silwood1]|nr:unnamed protein product [Rotaria sp. Silwood1]